MLFGPHPATIVAVQPIDIHGTHMTDIVYRLDNETSTRAARLGMEAMETMPAPGVRVIVHLLMNVVTRIEQAAD